MSVHVQRMESDVTVEPQVASGEAGGGGEMAMGEGISWEELDRMRHAQRAMGRDRQRTCARGFDD